MKYFGGVEGGATHSRAVICDESGTCCSSTAGPGTNHWTLGITECARRIADMVERMKKDANIPTEQCLESLGLSLSGCEQEATNRDLEAELRKNYPNLAVNYSVCSDTMGSIFTASPIGGMVVISGTGSNTLLRNPNGSLHSCGGWGYLLGDEGSAWYISFRAMKIVFDDVDGFEKAPYSIDTVWSIIKEYFNVESRLDLLPHVYANFEKSYFAGLCKNLSAAADKGDQLSLYLFEEAGQHIARSIHALLPKVHRDLIADGYLNIICVGSVWLSWHLLQKGFLKALSSKHIGFNLKLMTITKSAAYGACYLGVDAIGYDLPRNYSDNVKVKFVYTEKEHAKHKIIENGQKTTANAENGCSIPLKSI